jgi:hypothetical protein
MTVENPRIIHDANGYPILHLTIDGREVRLFWDSQKWTLTEAGLTYLGWEQELPPILFEVPGEPGNVHRLKGFTDNPRVHDLFMQYLRYCHDRTETDPAAFQFT